MIIWNKKRIYFTKAQTTTVQTKGHLCFYCDLFYAIKINTK
jgi:hypothetical protein